MSVFTFNQEIKQLEKRQGGYFYVTLTPTIVNQFSNQKKTRIICTIDDNLVLRCGLNHLGDGNFYIIISKSNLKIIGKEIGDTINFSIQEDPNPLGVDVPESLQVLLEQDEEAKKVYDALTDGKKRSLIYSIAKIKDIDRQIANSIKTLRLLQEKMNKK